MSLLCAIIGHKLNPTPNRTGERWCVRKDCTHRIPALRWPSPPREVEDTPRYLTRPMRGEDEEGSRTGRISCGHPTFDEYDKSMTKTMNYSAPSAIIYDNQAILEFIEEYEFGDEQVYIPTDQDRLMLTDFAYGLIDLLDQRARIKQDDK